MNLLVNILQLIATTLLVASGLLHLSTFVIHVPGVSIAALVILIVAIPMAIYCFGPLHTFCYYKFHAYPFQARWGFALMREIRERKADAESQILAYFTPKWSTLIGCAAGYLLLNGMFCFLLFCALAPAPELMTVEAQTVRDRLSDLYAGRFLSGTALLPATFAIVAMHVVLPSLMEETRQPRLPTDDLKPYAGESKPLPKK